MEKDVLGGSFDLSVVIAGDKLMERLNTVYRKKEGTTNVLSFPLSDDSGEIFINRTLAKKEAKEAGVSEKDYTEYLLLHSLLHLKGFDHGAKMKKKEDNLLRKYGINL